MLNCHTVRDIEFFCMFKLICIFSSIVLLDVLLFLGYDGCLGFSFCDNSVFVVVWKSLSV